MQKIVLIAFALVLFLNLNAQSPSFKTFTNPVIPGDHPDCTVTKVGNDFYTTGSSFNPTPVIYHSTDLVHWEAISQPVSASWSNYGDAPGGGCWGGHLVFYKGKWWNYFGRAFVMYFVKADHPEGPWSEPVKLKIPSQFTKGLGADNSIFIDSDSTWYLLVKNGQPNNWILQLGDDGHPTGKVYDLTWINPEPAFPYSWAEGPVMWKYKGYYYYSFARDVSGGQKVMRSKALSADKQAWEMLGDLFNESDPQKGTSLFTTPNHASPAVMLSDSTSWVLHPLWAKDDWRGQGRQGLLNQVRYNSSNRPIADYPVNKAFTAPNLPGSGIPWMVPKSDFFSEEKLNPEWSFIGYTAKTKTSLTDRPGWLRLSPKSSSKPNTVIKNDGEHNYSLITRVAFNPKSVNDEAGLRIIRGDAAKMVKLVSTKSAEGEKVVSFSFDTKKYELENWVGDTLWLKLVRVNHLISAYYGSKGHDWVKVGQDVDVSIIDSYFDNVSWSIWEGTRQGLYVAGSQDAWFDLYIYRDAFTPILAECPANQYGTTRTSLSQGIRNLDNIHNNDWALYAGVEFGNGDYYDLADSVEFTASGTVGGTIEVWLDSIDTGKKVSECAIVSTGNLSTFRKFKSAMSPVTGRHDLYLKFVGEGTAKLFQLKWMVFTRKSDQPNGSAIFGKALKIELFPNPAKSNLYIRSPFRFQTTEIFNANGQKVFQSNQEKSEMAQLELNLAQGMYLLKISGDNLVAVSKLMIEL